MQEEAACQPLVAHDVGPPLGCTCTMDKAEPDQGARDEPCDVSHELRTVLAIITLLSGNLDLFYERLDDEKRRTMIRDIRTQTRKLNNLVGDVLENRDESRLVLM